MRDFEIFNAKVRDRIKNIDNLKTAFEEITEKHKIKFKKLPESAYKTLRNTVSFLFGFERTDYLGLIVCSGIKAGVEFSFIAGIVKMLLMGKI